MSTENLKELRNALSCWQDDYDRDDDKEQYDMFGAAIDAVSRLEAAERERDELNKRLSYVRGHRDAELNKNTKLEAELARRDAAAREPKSWMTQEKMQSEANIYRHDNDEGTDAWFDATTALWTEGYLSPFAFHHIFKPDEAGGWLDYEIALIEGEGRSAQSYREIRNGETENPVVVVFDNGRAIVWDGFHRIAAAVARKEPVYAIFSYAAASPAVLPPGMKPEPEKYDVIDHGFIAGYNQCRADALALGAQQQKAVQLPMPFDVEINLTRTSGDIEYSYHEYGENFDRDEILAVLDAANVKYEVKK